MKRLKYILAGILLLCACNAPTVRYKLSYYPDVPLQSSDLKGMKVIEDYKKGSFLIVESPKLSQSKIDAIKQNPRVRFFTEDRPFKAID